jgi:hypothetical protein
MSGHEDKRIWKIRTVKGYAEAHSHILVGEVLSTQDSFVRLHCRTYHFGRSVSSPRDIKKGEYGVRVVPWSRIELVNELLSTFDYSKATLTADKEGNVILTDGRASCIIASSFDKRY